MNMTQSAKTFITLQMLKVNFSCTFLYFFMLTTDDVSCKRDEPKENQHLISLQFHTQTGSCFQHKICDESTVEYLHSTEQQRHQ